MPKRITAPKTKDGETDFAAQGFEDDDTELEESQSDSPAIQSTGIAVTYQERSITRTFGKQVLKSGGRITRYFTPEEHGRNYKKKAEEFIATLQLEDENKTERPKYIGHEEI